MASKVYNKALARMLDAFLVSSRDVRAILVMTNTTVDTEVDAIDYISDFTTLDEMDGSNYARAALANEAAAEDDVNDRGEFDADNITWTSLGAGTRNIQGVLLYEHVTNDADSEPICFIEFTSSVAADGSDFQIQWDDEGILRAYQA